MSLFQVSVLKNHECNEIIFHFLSFFVRNTRTKHAFLFYSAKELLKKLIDMEGKQGFPVFVHEDMISISSVVCVCMDVYGLCF